MVGIIKFFRDKDKLDQLVDGLFYCNTPEFYRLSDASGVSDHHESCANSFRKGRDSESIKLYINGFELPHIEKVTLHTNEHKDRWMHCWFALTIPQTDIELRALTDDINRMRDEFGCNYVFVEEKNIPILVGRLYTTTSLKIAHGLVKYSPNQFDWSAICKSDQYTYQREYRFLVGECSHSHVEPIKPKYDSGFSDLMYVNKKLELSSENQCLFYMDPNGCYITPHQYG
ncbi:hypothetical protein [Agarivorans sp. Z349TD_8]|uniref:hypothetical protein n=1 Tax=Agarivorans sp. Z349TD_8 TaxID=3421434 RepID=UPI003D7DBE99